MYDEDEIRMIDGMLGGCLQSLGGSAREAGVEKKGNNGMMGIGILVCCSFLFDNAGSIPEFVKVCFNMKSIIIKVRFHYKHGVFFVCFIATSMEYTFLLCA